MLAWLPSVHLAHLQPLFIRLRIDGRRLMEISAGELAKEGITVSGVLGL